MNKTNPKDYLDLLQVFSIGIVYGLISKYEITNWVDEIIQKDDEPDSFLIELSLIDNLSNSAISAIINEYIGEYNSNISHRVVFSILLSKLKTKQISLEKAVNVVEYLCLNHNLSNKEFNSLRFRFSDEFYLAKDCSIGTLPDIETRLADTLSFYKEFNLDNYKDWNKINQRIKVHTS